MSLRKNGHFLDSHTPPKKSCFYESDVIAFAENLVSIASQQIVERDETQHSIRLDWIMQCNVVRVEEKTDIVTRLLDRSLQAHGCDGSVGGILIPVSALASREQAIRGRTELLLPKNPTMTGVSNRRMNAIEAAIYLHCSLRTVGWLLDEGYIQGTRGNKGWLIDEHVVRNFSMTYVQLSLVAKELRTNQHILLRYCESRGIFTITLDGAGNRVLNHSYALKTNPNHLLSMLTSRQRSVNKKLVGWPAWRKCKINRAAGEQVAAYRL